MLGKNCNIRVHTTCENMMFFTKYNSDQIDDNVEKKRKILKFDDSENHVLIKNNLDEIDDTYVSSEEIGFCMDCIRNMIQKSIK